MWSKLQSPAYSKEAVFNELFHNYSCSLVQLNLINAIDNSPVGVVLLAAVPMATIFLASH